MGSPAPRLPPWADPFRILVDHHATYIGRRARYAGVRAADVPDVLQQVLLALHEAMGRGFDPSGAIQSWLRAVTYRIARDHRKLARNDRERLSATGLVETTDQAPNAEEGMQAIDAHRLVEEVLDRLPPEQRLVLVMSDIDEMPMSETAEVLEIPLGTGYTRLRAARRAFEEAWSAQRATGHPAVLPFELWEARDLIHAAQATPDLPREALDEIWRRLTVALGPGLVSAGAGAAAGATAAKAGAMLTAKQAGIGAVVALLAGAGLHAMLGSAGERAAAPVVVAGRDEAPATAVPATSSASASVAAATPPAASAPAGAAPPVRPGVAPDTEQAERTWFLAARDAVERGDFPAARAALTHLRSPRFAQEREELRRLLRAYEDGGP
jgi:RNA polymerase sigma-70 factor (ECF subfamily)